MAFSSSGWLSGHCRRLGGIRSPVVGRTRPPPPSCRNPCSRLGGNNHSPCCLHPDARGSPAPLPPSQTALKSGCLCPPPPGPGVSEGIRSLGLGWVVVQPGSHLPAVRGATGGFLGVEPAHSGRGAPGPAKCVCLAQGCSEVSRRPPRGSGSGARSGSGSHGHASASPCSSGFPGNGALGSGRGSPAWSPRDSRALVSDPARKEQRMLPLP